MEIFYYRIKLNCQSHHAIETILSPYLFCSIVSLGYFFIIYMLFFHCHHHCHSYQESSPSSLGIKNMKTCILNIFNSLITLYFLINFFQAILFTSTVAAFWQLFINSCNKGTDSFQLHWFMLCCHGGACHSRRGGNLHNSILAIVH